MGIDAFLDVFAGNLSIWPDSYQFNKLRQGTTIQVLTSLGERKQATSKLQPQPQKDPPP
ncbi:hypothetical protein BUALT_Bualt10G0044300 [Buddleja alternifolia]|uniref:Uncharacterized protein n=1 Tax=Buddleja alternifolia TaxID=168488 RepID=A0AAV6WV83_9LAMI|nr:hypothetical protein BUALT_Bualt10G0044300 [Buddleja alternifolia]